MSQGDIMNIKQKLYWLIINVIGIGIIIFFMKFICLLTCSINYTSGYINPLVLIPILIFYLINTICLKKRIVVYKQYCITNVFILIILIFQQIILLNSCYSTIIN